MKVLAVDDEPKILKLLEYHLKREGWDVKITSDSREALGIAKKFKPDLILLDVMMPNKSGFQICDDLRKESKTKDAKIFMLTAKTQMGDMETALKLGADDYLLKPFNPLTIAETLKKKLT